MIASTPPSKRVLDLLVPRMTELGYKYTKTGHWFRKPFAHGVLEFVLDFDGRGGLLTVTGGFFVRFTKLESLYKKATRESMPWTVGASFLNSEAKVSSYAVYDSTYGGLTPKEKSLIDPELVHPQKRIEEAVAYILDTHEQYALPLFAKVANYRQLADFLLDGLRGNPSSFKYFFVCPRKLTMTLIVLRTLGDDLSELYAIADAYDARGPWLRARDLMAKAEAFFQTATLADIQLD